MIETEVNPPRRWGAAQRKRKGLEMNSHLEPCASEHHAVNAEYRRPDFCMRDLDGVITGVPKLSLLGIERHARH